MLGTKFQILVLFILFASQSYAQFMNKDVEAIIIPEDQGEFMRYSAVAENKSLAEQNLTYEFSKFVRSDSGEVVKDSLGGGLVISAQERKKLNDVIINKNENRRIIILLAIYDQDGKPIGQNRIVLNDDDNPDKRIVLKTNESEEAQNQDMAAPQDGFFLEGLVVENTITKMGRDFHRFFYSKYYLSGLKSAKNIIIDELPFRARTTRITVKVDDQIVWQFFANPSQDFLQKQADYAFNNVVARLRQISNTKESITKY